MIRLLMAQPELVPIFIVAFLAALTIHEFSHGYSAFVLGDDTAKRYGRLTLNPLKHLDFVGALMFLFVGIGWAKPVPINPYNFKDMKIGTALTAAAGPASNFLVAIIVAMIYHLIPNPPASLASALYLIAYINVLLGLFNLLPIPPLDGSKIIGGFLSDEMFFKWMQWEQKGAYLLMIIFGISFLLRIPIFATIIFPPLQLILGLLFG
jgi:Zn-dependent protease